MPSPETDHAEQANGAERACVRGSSVEARGRITGGRLAAASALVFLLPPIGLIVGAGLGEEGVQGPLTGACIGFFVGVGLAWLITRWWHPQ